MEAAKQAVSFAKKNKDLKGLLGEKVFYKKKEVKLKAPLPRPNKILNFGINHKGTLATLPNLPKKPMIFDKAATSVIGDGENIVLLPPDVSQLTTTEVELGVIIGKKARMVPAQKAYDVIFGYTVFNDITAQERYDLFKFGKSLGEMLVGKKLPTEPPESILTSGMMEMKSWDTFGPMGPCIVTKDEIPDPHALHYECKINGEIGQQGTSADLYWKIPQIVETYSRILTLEPGDLISTGTCGINAKAILKPGSTVETTIKEIGTINNKTVAWSDVWK